MTMKLADVLQQLDADAAGKNRVMLGPLRKMGKKLKTNHPLALELWATGRTDARILAAMLMAPDHLTAKEAETMLASLTDSQLVDELTAVIADSPIADDLREKWLGSKKDLTGRAGWNLTVGKILRKGLASGDCEALLKTIESQMKAVSTKTAESMMRCLVEIGVRFPEHRPRAIDIGTRWGRIDDRPVPKGCTPFHAVEWIEAILKRRK